MSERKNCMGCGTVVVNPVVCNNCEAVSHPGCVSRTGHAYSNKRFLDCRGAATRDNSLNDGLLNNIRQVIKEEFTKFREEFLEIYRADLAKVKGEIQELTNKIELIERRVIEQQQTPSLSLTDDIIEEMRDREIRSRNLIFHQVDEVDSSRDDGLLDSELVKDIFRKIQPDKPVNFKCTRLGKKRRGVVRPLRVVLDSEQDVISLLRLRSRYTGPVKIFRDQTVKQRKRFSDLRDELKCLRETGDSDKSIRYFNGVPKIVSVNKGSNIKNGNTPL